MNAINQTLYIPLYGKAYVSKKRIILQDFRAEEIWEAESFNLKGKAKSKWLAYYMGMRAAVFDQWISEKMKEYPDAIILHLGCGMDSRFLRVNSQKRYWYDVDFPDVIRERRRYFMESEFYKMISADIRREDWMVEIPKGRQVLLVMEGISMYLTHQELCCLMESVKHTFPGCCILMDCYTSLAASATKYKNPINEVGVTKVYGLDDPAMLPIQFVKEHDITPVNLIEQLDNVERRVFRAVFAGAFSRKLYRLYEFCI